MRRRFAGILAVSVLLAAGIISGCGQTAATTAPAEEKAQKSAETAEEKEEETVPAGTPIAMEAGASTTPSGMTVQTKFCQYKVIQGVNLRSDCNKESEMVGSLFTGDVIQGTGVCENGWIQFTYGGQYCYATGSCFQETEDPVNASPDEEADAAPTPAGTDAPPAPTSAPISTLTPEVTVDVTDWAKYTSSRWESDAATSCVLQIHSIAGNQVVLSFQVIDGPLSGKDAPGTLIAEASNCYGKIEHGVMNFSFTDSYGNAGVGQMTIVDERHLNIATVISLPAEGAEYSAAIMTGLSEVE